jgi:hypothetical protein
LYDPFQELPLYWKEKRWPNILLVKKCV